MTLSKVVSSSQSWVAGGKFKGFGVRSSDSPSGHSMLRELGEPLHLPPPLCPLRRRSAGPSPGINMAAFAECPAQSRCQRLVGSKEHLPNVGMEASEEPFRGPAGSRPAPSQVTLAVSQGVGWAVVRVDDHRFLRVQREPEGRQRIRGETRSLMAWSGWEGAGGWQGLEPGLCALLPARDAQAAMIPTAGWARPPPGSLGAALCAPGCPPA